MTVKVLVECLKGTKEKYEKSTNGDTLILDRLLKRKWVANYGCILNTLQADGDELDCYIIGVKLDRGQVIDAMPICIIYVIDNMVVDNKIICAAPTAGKYNINKLVKKIFRFIHKYKKNSFPVSASYKSANIQYELAKCQAYYNLFRGGKSGCQH